MIRSLRSSNLRHRQLLWLCLICAGLLLLGWRTSSFIFYVLAGLGGLFLLILAGVELRHLQVTYRAHELTMREAHDGLWSWYPLSKELNVGQRLLTLLGYDENLVPDTYAWLELVHPDDRAHYNQSVSRHLKGETPHFYCEYRVRARNGEYRWLAARGLALRNRRGKAYLMAGSVSDISERRAMEEQARFLAYHDQLTALPNRLLLADFLPKAMARAKRQDQLVAVLFIDLDRFKDINDSLGHEAGDFLLQVLAKRLKGNVRDSDIIVRQGGDEFIIVLAGLADVMDAHAVASKILYAVAAPVDHDGRELCVTASIGITTFPEDGNSPDILLRNADTAMYQAKANGGNCLRFYTVEMNEAIQQRVKIEAGLRHAIEKNQLQLYLQPQFDLGSGCLSGCEALLRWRSDEGGFIPPDQFIPVAENSGLILPIGDWVIERALALLVEWHEAGLTVPQLAINVSARQLWRHGLSERLLGKMAAAGIAPAQLEIEVTESVFLRSDEDSLSELRQLAAAGIRLALDDFGTGYSSLSYLKMLPFQTLKIDRGFIREIESANGDDASIVSAIIAMAGRLGMQVVAEGVETGAQRARLAEMQCDIVQGFLYSPALEASEFARRYLQPVSGSAG